MPRKRRSWLKVVGIGCGSLAILLVIAAGGLMVTVRILSGRAIGLRQELERDYGTVTAYTPPPGGAIPGDRVERFLAVRAVLAENCDTFASLTNAFQTMDSRVNRLHEEGEQRELTWRDMLPVVTGGGGVLREMAGLGPALARYEIARNQALLDNGMGLGEYTWIYVTAYDGWLGHRPEAFAIEKQHRPRIFQDRVRSEVVEMLRRMVASGAGSAWGDELDALNARPERIPFETGIPDQLRRSFEPYRDRLERTYCPATSELDIMRTEKDGWRFEHR